MQNTSPSVETEGSVVQTSCKNCWCGWQNSLGSGRTLQVQMYHWTLKYTAAHLVIQIS